MPQRINLANITIVLHQPRYPQNIGAAARAMLNMGIPSIWKYLILTVSSYVVSNLLASGIRMLGKRVRILKQE